MTARYTTREGAYWELTDLREHSFLPGFWWARRVGDTTLLCVHEHRMTFHRETPVAPPDALSAATQTINPS